MNKGQHAQSTFLLAAFSYVLLSMSCNKITADLHKCRTTSSAPQQALAGHVIKTLNGKRLETCVAACDFEQTCFSINYFLTSKRCELNRRTAEWYPADLVPTPDSVYLTIVSRDYSPCVDQQPPCRGVCVPIPGSLATQCVCEGNQTCGNDSCIPQPLGMEDGSIRSDQISVSTNHGNSDADWGRLNNPQGGWTPNTDFGYQWFQVNFDSQVKLITHIATQGKGNFDWYVRKYYLMYKVGGSALQEYLEGGSQKIFQGNTDKDGIVKNMINNPFKADAVRIVPTSFTGRIALRVELYGCNT